MNENYTVEEITSGRIGESYTRVRHSSGLEIRIYPKKFSTYYAMFGTRYGSIDRTFDAGEGAITVPDGIAHFLEHKMFENADGHDAFEQFASVGADANAFTSNELTCYLFSCTDRFYEALRILLEFVTHPYFTDSSVKKEQGIIAQEIRMYEDNPQSRLYNDMLSALYAVHPLRVDVAGTVESIAKITPELLYACHSRFYTPANMFLAVCGDVTPQEVMATVDSVLPASAPLPPERVFPREKAQVASPRVSRRMQVAKPLFNIGVKNIVIEADPAERAKTQAALDILCMMYFGSSSVFYNKLYDEGLLSQEFDYSNNHGKLYSFCCISGESRDPEEVYRRFRAEIDRAASGGIDRQAFERSRRATLASSIGRFDSTQSIVNMIVDTTIDDCELYTALDAAESVRIEDISRLTREYFAPDHCTLAVVEPLEWGDK